MCVLTQLSLFTSLVTQCSHFTRSKVFMQQHHGLLSKELQKVDLIGSTATEEAGKSKQGSFANRGCFYLRMSKWSKEECRTKRTFPVGAQDFFKVDSTNLKIINQWLDYKNK